MNTKDMPSRDRNEDRSTRQEKLGHASETSPSKNLVDRESNRRRQEHRPDKKHAAQTSSSGEKSSETRTTVAEAAFQIKAPAATQVHVAGSFNDWNPNVTPLHAEAGGAWSARLKLPPGVYEYRFIVDGEWRDDPVAPQYTTNPFGTKNAVINVQ